MKGESAYQVEQVGVHTTGKRTKMGHNATMQLVPLVELTFMLKRSGTLAAAGRKGVRIAHTITSEFFR